MLVTDINYRTSSKTILTEKEPLPPSPTPLLKKKKLFKNNLDYFANTSFTIFGPGWCVPALRRRGNSINLGVRILVLILAWGKLFHLLIKWEMELISLPQRWMRKIISGILKKCKHFLLPISFPFCLFLLACVWHSFQGSLSSSVMLLPVAQERVHSCGTVKKNIIYNSS